MRLSWMPKMIDLIFDQALDRLASRVIPLERFVHHLGARFDPPHLFKSLDERGYRFKNPDYRHFCLLRACRIVSALNASIALARFGHVQEIGVLLRTVIEYSSQVEYILLNRNEQGVVTGKAAAFVSSFFEDNRRTGQGTNRKRVKLNQKDVHEAIGANLDEFNLTARSRTTSELMSHVYLVFSNYVHGRYPESMDLFGGRPGRFHLHGMRGTPKDQENIELIDTLITSASNCFIQVAQGLKMQSSIASDKILADWYQDGVSGI
jgi:hypothetical protein